MTLYEEGNEQFRPGPRLPSLLVTATSAVFIGAVFASLSVAAIITLLARYSGWTDEWFFYSPLFDQVLTAIYSSPPLDGSYRLAGVIIPAGSLLLALFLTQFWPFDQTLASRFVLQAVALNLVAYGVFAAAFEPRVIQDLRTEISVPPIATIVLLLATGTWAVMLIERRMIELLGNIWWVDTPIRRVRRWLPRIPLPFLTLAAIAYWNENPPLAYSHLLVIGASLLENLSRTPPNTFEEVRRPHMREAAFTTPVSAVLLMAAVLWPFGLTRVAGLTPRVLSSPGPALEPVASARGLIDLRIRVRKEEEKKRIEAEKPKIDIHWSRPRKTRPKGK